MFVYQLKTYHEHALDEWNATARVLYEAVNLSKVEQERHHTFIKTIMELTEIAKGNETRKENIIKAASIMLAAL